jgi:hypothetical protein
VADFQIRALAAWPYPDSAERLSSATFRARWDDTVALLRDEADWLGALEPIVLQLVCDPADLRRDGMLRARAAVRHPGVIVTLATRDRGSLVFATDMYVQCYGQAMLGWQANVRAVALGLKALRAVDRYRITRHAEQYAGFRALTAGGITDSECFASVDAALCWLRARGGVLADAGPWPAYRAAVRALHPDIGGSREDWDRLQQARRLLEEGGLL